MYKHMENKIKHIVLPYIVEIAEYFINLQNIT